MLIPTQNSRLVVIDPQRAFVDREESLALTQVSKNCSCEWATGIELCPHDVVVTKHQADAGESATFRDVIELAIADGVEQFFVVGFQFTTCVAASAVSTVNMVRPRGARVTVIKELSGSRGSSHLPGASGVSRVESTRQHLQNAGVELI
jgi:nicotinamidase-related amidase